jgi:hypothetical protein
MDRGLEALRRLRDVAQGLVRDLLADGLSVRADAEDDGAAGAVCEGAEAPLAGGDWVYVAAMLGVCAAVAVEDAVAVVE